MQPSTTNMGYSTPTKNTTTINHINHPLIRKSSTASTVDCLTSTPSFTTLYNDEEHETEERKKKITVDDNGSVFIPDLSANATNEKMVISIDDIPDLPFDMMSFSSSPTHTTQRQQLLDFDDHDIPSSLSPTTTNNTSTTDISTTDPSTTQPRSSRLLKSTTNNNKITTTEIKERNEARRKIRLSLRSSPFSSAAIITQCVVFMVGMVLISSFGVDEA